MSFWAAFSINAAAFALLALGVACIIAGVYEMGRLEQRHGSIDGAWKCDKKMARTCTKIFITGLALLIVSFILRPTYGI